MTDTTCMDRHDLQQFIDTQQIEAEIIPLGEHTTTVEDAARALAVDTDRIIKSLVFKCKKEYVLVINNGTARVDKSKVAAHLGIGKNRVRFASPESALDVTGFIVGSMPPFGHRTRLRTLVDPAVMGLNAIYGGGGSIDTMMRLTPGEMLRVTGAEVAAVSE